MVASIHWTVKDLEGFPRVDGNRYEIIEGVLHVTTTPSVEHQLICGRIHLGLGTWNKQTGSGEVLLALGVIFSEDNAVAPDLLWVSRARLPQLIGPDRHLHDAPELMIEVISPGRENERRDREIKLDLYSRRGVRECWIVDWVHRQGAVYRREEGALRLSATLQEADTLTSPLLPGFTCPLSELFAELPA